MDLQKSVITKNQEILQLWRDAVQSDIKEIQKLIPNQTAMESIFGITDLCIFNLIETTSLTQVLLNQNSEIIAFITLHYQSNLHSIHPLYWTEWIHNLYGLKDVNYENSMFLNFMCWKEDICIIDTMESFLKNYFLDNPLVYFIIWIIPPNFAKFEKYKEVLDVMKYQRVYPIGLEGNDNVSSLIIMQREMFIPKLTYRLAVLVFYLYLVQMQNF